MAAAAPCLERHEKSMRVRLIFYCPRCGSRLIRLSGKRKRMDWLLALLTLRGHRCEMCRHRFYLPYVTPSNHWFSGKYLH